MTARGVRRTIVATSCALILAASLTACSEPQDAPDAAAPADAYIDLVLDVSLEEAEQQQMRQEEALAVCMAKAGFEYVPSLVNMVGFVNEAAIDPPRDSREFAEAYGYGLGSLPPGAVSPYVADPNEEITAAMSEAESAEYFLARDGSMPDGDDPDWKANGCEVWASGEMQAGAPDYDPTYLALKAEVERIDTDVVPADPDVVAADAAWAECMADAGFPDYTRQPEAQEEEYWHYYDPEMSGAVGPDGLTDGVRAEIPRERALATADWDCTDQVGYADVVAPVRDAAQQEYVDAHRDELDAWVEAYFDTAQPTP